MTLAGWGRVPISDGCEIRSERLDQITRDVPLTRGLGRAYGDAALPARGDHRVAGSSLADRIITFDPESGLLAAEAGLSLDAICRALLPRGYFTPVSPGTRFVTLGGMVACDIHGKNHHRDGCFGQHVERLTLRVADGTVVQCSPFEQPDLFFATIGGMGLTGHILEVSFRLAKVPSPWIYQETERIAGLDEFLEALETASRLWPMTAGWIDCLSRGRGMGRGILYRGRWATPSEAPATPPLFRAPISVGFVAPDGLLGRPVVRLFNGANYRKHVPRRKRAVVHPAAFLYPLDVVGNWNLLYGPRGFVQYQCVLPRAGGRQAVRRFLDVVTTNGAASFLCVIKDCGPEGKGLLSFPLEGTTIALDLPFTDDTQRLVDQMNDLVAAAGGRIYLAKDALTRAEHFRAMEPRRDRFLAVRRQWDPDGRIRSAQSVRLFGW
jgi:decaprenylphospho-beta-D-ribofuranose 2-oxidase